eukprot:GHUV01038886.1.p3 GENE.GHUV01038886.1~~GHUV01038886.1.p3  ORF type:complete len:105 (+),score=16.34 GHUV01038886.1:234-548(+)
MQRQRTAVCMSFQGTAVKASSQVFGFSFCLWCAGSSVLLVTCFWLELQFLSRFKAQICTMVDSAIVVDEHIAYISQHPRSNWDNIDISGTAETAAASLSTPESL